MGHISYQEVKITKSQSIFFSQLNRNQLPELVHLISRSHSRSDRLFLETKQAAVMRLVCSEDRLNSLAQSGALSVSHASHEDKLWCLSKLAGDVQDLLELKQDTVYSDKKVS